MKYKILFLLSTSFFFLPVSSRAVDIAPRISDREIIESLAELKAGQAGLDKRMDQLTKSINQRFEDQWEKTDQRFEALNQRIEDQGKNINQRIEDQGKNINQRIEDQGKKPTSGLMT